MEITNFDFELKYEPGRNELDPLDYISRHPVSENHQDNAEQVINHISRKENAETQDGIRIETKKDHKLRKLILHVINNDWIKAEKDLEMSPYKRIKEEISIIEGIVYREDKMIIPNSLQKKIAKIGHYLRHLGRTKTKQNKTKKKKTNKQTKINLLRWYWFPDNKIEKIID